MLAQPYKPVNLDNKSVRQILRAAQELWTRAGYHGASLKDIAAEAGVAKSLVHYHFASKEHLLIELQAVWCHRVAAAVRARLASAPPSHAAAFAALDQVFEAMVATRAQFPFAIEIWRQSLEHPSIRARLQAFERELRGLYADGLRQTLGPLADRMSLPVERAAAFLQALLAGLALRLFLDDDTAAVRQIFEDAKALLAASLLPPTLTGGRS